MKASEDEPAVPVEQASHAQGAEPRASAGNRAGYVGWIVLALYVLLLAGRALSGGASGGGPGIGVWELHDERRVGEWIGRLVLGAVCGSAYFIPVGFLAALILPRGSNWLGRLLSGLLVLTLAGALTVSVCAVGTAGSWRPLMAVSCVLPLLGSLLGTWMGAAWRRGRRARLWLLPKMAVLAAVAALGLGILAWRSLESEPLPFDMAPVTSAEKRRLVHLVRGNNPTSLEPHETRALQLTEHDLNVLLSWGLSLGAPERKARLRLAENSVSLQGSARVPLGTAGPRFLNLELTGGVGIESGSLNLRVDGCRVGSFEVPHWLLTPVVSVARSHLGHDRRSRPFLDATRHMAIGAGFVEITYGVLHLPPELRKDLFGPTTVSEEVLAATQAQIDHLLEVAARTHPAELTFNRCLETVFALARTRSVQGDPVLENRAGIFALGILLGHPRVGSLLGPVFAGDREAPTRLALYRVAVRGRSDWTKHFCVSAVLAVLSDAAVSGAAGLLKEELDADRGGSGFSFADLLADRAGAVFALQATRDEAAARALQNRLADGFTVGEVFPLAADLPEGIPDARLQSQYGGVGGEGYQRLIEEIERRVAACAAYR
ncbi:MAG: hypothetical protein FJ280_25555 [Planctomycetes bacterium]|nr:hypothetical protein [Planctomycetota bacterium]